MAWKKIEKYELKWNIKKNDGEIALFFKGVGQVKYSKLQHETFSAMVDVLRNEKSRWFEDEYQILATGDKQPEAIQPTKESAPINFNGLYELIGDEEESRW